MLRPRIARPALALTLLVVASAAGVRADGPGWTTLAPPDGGFRVEMPGPPQQERREHWTPLGVVRERKYGTRVGGVELAVESHDVPAIPAAWMGPDRVLERARRGVLDHVHGEVLEDHALPFEGVPAREFVYRHPGEPARVERVRAVLVGSRLFLVFATSADPRQHPAARRFFDSFHLERAVSAGPPEREVDSEPAP